MQSFFSHKLKPHINHQIGLIYYGDNNSDDIGIFCTTCNKVILSEHDFKKDWSKYYYKKFIEAMNKLMNDEEDT